MPNDWKVGDKTGRSGDGAVNDIAILRPPGHAPIFLAIYTFQPGATNDAQGKVIAQIARRATDADAPDR